MSEIERRVRLNAGWIETFSCPVGKSQAFLWDKNSPSLALRVTPTGRKTYICEARLNGKTVRTTIGTVADWPIAEARIKASQIKQQLDTGQDPRELKRQADAKAKAELKAKQEAQHCTLGNLLELYCQTMQAQGQISFRDVRSIFNVHVLQPWPEIAAMPANEVTDEQIADMMRRTVSQGKGRTANTLRSYLRAAYQKARQARTDASIPEEFKAFNVRQNPVSETSPIKAANKPDKNPLTLEEMRTYWQAIKGMDNFHGAVLRLHLLTGGQRIEQLVRLKTRDIGDKEILIFDGKGRPGTPPRNHVVPLIPPAEQALRDCKPFGEWAMSTDGGKTHVTSETLSAWARNAAEAAGISGFQTKRIRSGVETALSRKRVQKEERGHLQSHGISGVQSRHYDGYEFMDEKRAALKLMFQLLDEPDGGKVINFPVAA